MNKLQGLKGSIVALVTPFREDGSVNFEQLRQWVEWHIENKTDAILTLGTTGESSTMSHEEDDETLRCVVETAAGRVPVIAGTGSNSTQTMLEKSQRAQDLGADGSTTSPAALGAPSRPRWWSASASTPTWRASRRPAATCPTP